MGTHLDIATRHSIMGMAFDPHTYESLTSTIVDNAERGVGGWVLTANVDILRRSVVEPEVGRLYREADICVADGMPIVWYSWIAGSRLPERVAGSTFATWLCERAATRGLSVFLLGASPETATLAAASLTAKYPNLDVCGIRSPSFSMPPTNEELKHTVHHVQESNARIVFVALGSPKQEYVCRELRRALPHLWCIGVGFTLSFIAGAAPRAPAWMQRVGLEWVHRLAHEPGRLAKRYLLDDIPFAMRMMTRAIVERARART